MGGRVNSKILGMFRDIWKDITKLCENYSDHLKEMDSDLDVDDDDYESRRDEVERNMKSMSDEELKHLQGLFNKAHDEFQRTSHCLKNWV